MWWLALAWAAKPTDFSEKTCPSTYELFKAHIGYGQGKTRAGALAAAREAAERLARKSACLEIAAGSTRCDEAMAHAVPAGPGQAFRERGTFQACFSLAVDYDKLATFQADLRDLDRKIVAFGREIRQVVGEVPVYLTGPRFHTGCAASRSGPQIRQVVMGQMASLLRIPRPDAAWVKLELTVVDDADARVSAYVQRPGELVERPVLSEPWPAVLIGERAAQALECLSDGDMGLSSAPRVPSGLQLSLEVDPDRSEFCDGEEARISMSSSEPARVRLLSVDPEGRAIQFWPAQGEPDRIGLDPTPLDVTMLLARHGQERLVGIAIPEGGDWGQLSGTRACRVPGRWRADRAPVGAALQTGLTYRVTQDARLCDTARVNKSRKQALETALEQLPACW